ncbi:MAG: YdcF family protein [Clostridiales bacterium]|jgi:uncharacterized SAM-binding protein YcdF (DUF218 family)|nr:YdcF family protein [Clostridiales bacterium]
MKTGESPEKRGEVIKEYRYIEPRFAPVNKRKSAKPLLASAGSDISKKLYRRKKSHIAVMSLRIALLVFALLLTIDGVACLIYVTFGLGTVLPLALGLGIFAYFILEGQIAKFLRTRFGRVIGVIVGILASIGLASFIAFVSVTLIQSAQAPDTNRDAILVLGGSLHGEELSPPLRARLEVALKYAQDNPSSLLVVSGGQGPGEDIPEAQAMARYLTEHGISEDRIIQEDSSKSTEENISFSKTLLDGTLGEGWNTVIVTNRFHIFRALKTAKKFELDVQPLAAPSRPFYLLPNNYFREYAAIIYYFVTGKY